MSETAPSPDLLLARRAAAGHADAWEELIDRYGRRLYNLALQFAGSPEEAEDLTQEIFLRLYRNLRSFKGEVPLIAWALRLSKNLCIDHYRKLRRERSWTRVPEVLLEYLPSHSNSPEQHSQHRQQLEVVYTALAELPEEMAELVLIRDLQGWSLNEAAAYLQIPLGTLKSRLHRGRKLLTDRVNKLLSCPPPGCGQEALSC